MQYDVLVVGGGPAGIWAATQCAILGLKSILVERLEHLGGQCHYLYPDKYIYDIPGCHSIMAKDLIKNLMKQAKLFDVNMVTDISIINMKKKEPNSFNIMTSKGEINCKSIIIASGKGSMTHIKLPIENIDEFENHSIFYSVKNRDFFIGKRIVIAGGGDSAIDWAINLSDIAKDIVVIHRRDKFRAALGNVNKMHENKKITTLTPYKITNVNGQGKKIHSVHVENIEDGEKVTIDCDFLLAFYGLAPAQNYLDNWGLKFNARNKILSDIATCETNIEGIFAIGDSSYSDQIKPKKLIVTGFDEGTQAAYHIFKRLYPEQKINYSTNINMKNP